MANESLKQLELEETIKNQAQLFLNWINSELPESMELEYEGFYRRGFFVSKKRYAVIEDGNIIAKGLELVRRDWAPVAKNIQQKVLMNILSEGNVDEAVKEIKKVLKDIKTGTIPMKDLIIHTQITKKLSDYKNTGPHVVAAQKLKAKGIDVSKGTIIQYIIIKGKGLISERAIPYDYSDGTEYDIDYYINHQIIPAVSRIMESFGYTKEKLIELGEKEKQSSLDEFF